MPHFTALLRGCVEKVKEDSGITKRTKRTKRTKKTKEIRGYSVTQKNGVGPLV